MQDKIILSGILLGNDRNFCYNSFSMLPHKKIEQNDGQKNRRHPLRMAPFLHSRHNIYPFPLCSTPPPSQCCLLNPH